MELRTFYGCPINDDFLIGKQVPRRCKSLSRLYKQLIGQGLSLDVRAPSSFGIFERGFLMWSPRSIGFEILSLVSCEFVDLLFCRVSLEEMFVLSISSGFILW